MKIAIIFGGVSFEREVSIETAKSILLNIDNKYDILEIDYCDNYYRLIEQIKVNRIDLVFNALHGGDGENGVLQKVLEDNNIRFTGSGSDACKKAMNKSITKDICNKNNIPVPEGLIINDFDQLYDIHERGIIFSNKIVIKPIDEGSSADLYIMNNNPGGLNSSLYQKTEYMLRKYESFLLEEYIEGRELTIGILNGIALPIVEIIPKERLYNYECKYTAGMSEYSVPAKLDCKIKQEHKMDDLGLS